jgi:DNA-binding LytR/AlgR family response regulator
MRTSLKKLPKKTAVKKVELQNKNGTTLVSVHKIMMVMSESHKVKVLVDSLKPAWYERNESLEKFFSILPRNKFEKISKFYIINWNYVPSYFNKEKIITFNTGFSVELKHKIKLSVFKDIH